MLLKFAVFRNSSPMHRATFGYCFRRTLAVGAGTVSVVGAGLLYALENAVKVEAFEHFPHPASLPWDHKRVFGTIDMASARRGYEVYKQVCKACHSMKWIAYRHLVGNIMTEEEAKAEAAAITVPDIDEAGNAIERQGDLNDHLLSPYPNVAAAKAANGGAFPPDLSMLLLTREGAEDYVFSLLTSYVDTPAGVKLDEGKHYNPYFPDGVISMPQQLFDGGIEYKDGTPATASQQAKDICTFMRWTAEPFYEKKKRLFLKSLLLLPLLTFVLVYGKRHAWTYIKGRKSMWVTVKGRERPKSKSN
ncbi:Cytochrome C1 family protein [Brugia malayi]|uniref:BMA-CYC-1 n=1 Tax=Brugia malayi TaxID=6279 RepID=A0A0K0IZY1_BRUMA|nr:Cytochrome C1 family protein [Brugia malayi]CDQ05197.1 BMA-CYC-1 [Brugia malayi]VIO95281.1 Cytochrome C1 family protein [Brugia malayi]